jgi:HEAT repeat protein
MRSLGESTTVNDVPALAVLLNHLRDSNDLESAEEALGALYVRTDEKNRWVDSLLMSYRSANPAARAALLRVMTRHGGQKVLKTVSAAVEDPSPLVRDAAVTALAEWDSAAPAANLLQIASQSSTLKHRLIALRGYLRMAGREDVIPSQRLAMCKEGLRLADRDEERRLALGALAGLADEEALALTISFLGKQGLADEAATASIAIGRRLLPSSARKVSESMEVVLRSVQTEELRRQAVDLRATAAQMAK